MVHVGEAAPDFTLEDERGNPVTLSEIVGEQLIVLFFYPKDNTPICTDEACGFRDQYAVISRSGAEVFGLSADDKDSHRAFRKKHELPYRLLTDTDRAVAKAYGATAAFGLVAGRMTVVIDRQGKIAHVTSAMFNADVHVREAQAFVLEDAHGKG